jgi:hypothetical protein
MGEANVGEMTSPAAAGPVSKETSYESLKVSHECHMNMALCDIPRQAKPLGIDTVTDRYRSMQH